jgi:hypothetical protein
VIDGDILTVKGAMTRSRPVEVLRFVVARAALIEEAIRP